MESFRQVFAVICCIVAGPICLYRYYAGQPSLSELRKIEGVVQEIEMVTRSRKYGSARHPLIRLRGVSTAFSYLDWFPDTDKLARSVAPGDEVTIWVDQGRNDWLWQLERDGEMVIAYDDIAAAVRHNNRFDAVLGFGLLAAAGFAIWRARVRRNQGTEKA